jgi:hypothetical protein
MVFHVQLMWLSWLIDQIISDTHLPFPDFCTGLRNLEQKNNLSWVPSCANVPQLQAMLQVTYMVGGRAHHSSRHVGAGNVGGNIGG